MLIEALRSMTLTSPKAPKSSFSNRAYLTAVNLCQHSTKAAFSSRFSGW